jgi:DNA-binding HxlR family transcriptional regulator
MTTYGQFCAVARAHEVLGGRWTLLIVRELLSGAARFGEIRRGIPRISRTMLSERLRALAEVGAVTKDEDTQGPLYELTPSGRELASLVGALATWGQRWLPRRAVTEDLDLEPLLVDMQRRVRFTALPRQPLVLRIELARQPRYRLLLRPTEASLCTENPGFPEPLRLGGPLAALAGWWRGDHDFAAARRAGLLLEGPRALTRAFPDWFERYLFHDVRPAA